WLNFLRKSARLYIPPPLFSASEIGLAALGRQLLDLFVLHLRQPRQHPQVMHQHRPGHGQLTVRKAFAAHPSPEKHVLENGDAPFGLRPAPLHALEFPRTVPLPELPGRTGTDPVENLLFFEAEAVVLAIE